MDDSSSNEVQEIKEKIRVLKLRIQEIDRLIVSKKSIIAGIDERLAELRSSSSACPESFIEEG